mmetsp:Transcript_87164/g.241691  ORF Transcript_87164/g.241691 Transcript_87164/m.241691 type:complete len:165 (+) Transcript_87164:61-555(+)
MVRSGSAPPLGTPARGEGRWQLRRARSTAFGDDLLVAALGRRGRAVASAEPALLANVRVRWPHFRAAGQLPPLVVEVDADGIVKVRFECCRVRDSAACFACNCAEVSRPRHYLSLRELDGARSRCEELRMRDERARHCKALMQVLPPCLPLCVGSLVAEFALGR